MVVGYIVEGKNDALRVLKAIPEARVYPLGGTKFGRKMQIPVEKALSECDAVFSLADPDPAGELINNALQQNHPSVRMVSLDPNECKIEKRVGRKIITKYGIEYCELNYLRDIHLANLQNIV